jgi:hypothetical protein
LLGSAGAGAADSTFGSGAGAGGAAAGFGSTGGVTGAGAAGAGVAGAAGAGTAGLGRETIGCTVGRVGAVTSITGRLGASGCMLMLIVSCAQLVVGIVQLNKSFTNQIIQY